MLITLIRHAETEGNLKHQFIGRIDQPLAKEGIQTAQNAPHYPDVKKVYTSNLQRTIQTAKILFPNAEIEEVQGLREIDFGLIEGRSHDELMKDPEYRKLLEEKTFPQAPDGEDLEEFTLRCASSFKRIVEAEFAASSKEVNFVIHGGTIMTLMNKFANPSREFFDWRVNNCKGYCLETNNGKVDDASLKLISEV